MVHLGQYEYSTLSNFVTNLATMVSFYKRHAHFFPDFFIPPPTIGPFFPAFSAASFKAFCCSRCLALNALSSSSSSACCFLGALSGFFLPPSRPDILNFKL